MHRSKTISNLHNLEIILFIYDPCRQAGQTNHNKIVCGLTFFCSLCWTIPEHSVYLSPIAVYAYKCTHSTIHYLVDGSVLFCHWLDQTNRLACSLLVTIYYKKTVYANCHVYAYSSYIIQIKCLYFADRLLVRSNSCLHHWVWRMCWLISAMVW
jgi:hypothetical protein